MADNIDTENQDTVDKKFSSEDVSKIVKERLERANAGKDELAARIADLETKHNNLAQAARQVNIAPAPVVDAQAALPVAPEGAPNAPLTQDNLAQVLQAHQAQQSQQQQDQQFKQASDYHDQNLQTLMGGDKDFDELVKNNQEKVPRAVAIHVSNNFSPDSAKKIFKELLSNENTNLKMKNAYLEELTQPETGAYQKWLGQLMQQNGGGAPSDEKAPSPVPELNSVESGSDDD